MISRLLVSIGLLTLSGLALADRGTDLMVAQCEDVMRCELCKIELDNKVYTNETTEILVAGTGKFTVLTRKYLYIRNARDTKLPDGRHLMCVRVREAMEGTDEELKMVAKLSFNSNWDRRKYCP